MKDDEKKTIRRIYNCSNKLCKDSCVYCNYRDQASKMVLEFILMDMHTFYKNNNKMLGAWDVKDIINQTYKKLREMENNITKEEEND